MFCSFSEGVSADVTAINGHIIWNLILTSSQSQGTPVEWTTKGDFKALYPYWLITLLLSVLIIWYIDVLFTEPPSSDYN